MTGRRRQAQKKSPAYQWYPKDYQTDAAVIVMTLAQEGAYRRLMDTCWLEHGLPTDPDHLWRIAKADSRAHFDAELWPSMYHKFTERDGKLQHPRLDAERSKQRKNRKARQLAARARWTKEQSRGDANALQTPSLASPIAIATAVRTRTPPNPPHGGGRRLTAGELDKARKHVATIGGCPHGVTHSVGECARLIALAWRGEAVPA